MPEMDGYDFLEEVSQDEGMADTPVIIVAAPSAELEAAPLKGGWQLTRETGFTLTEALKILQSMLSVVTQPPAMAPASAAALAKNRPA